MKLARWIFLSAGLYGLVVTAPIYWMEEALGRDYPPAITHPEYFYGFLGVTLAWQILFLLLARDPVRYRPMMWPAMVEKGLYVAAVTVLFLQRRIPTLVLGFGLVDLLFGLLFVVAYVATRPARMDESLRPAHPG
ncbi:MAG: hypothetical protein KJZ93_09545 [Caldilineaceae bacterium]|nr:hypothetical protein [Caldilineaceae bacterium]